MDGDEGAARGHGLPPVPPMVRLTRLHASIVSGEAIMAVALADSMFLSIGPNEARPRIFFFLVFSFAPFVLVAKFIGPFINGIRGGQRTVMFGVALMRAVLMVGLVTSIKSLAVFPLAFGALVLSKTYSISKSAMVPLLEHDEEKLVEANSRLAKVGGIIGFVIGIPAFVLQTVSTTFTLYAGALVFLFAAYQAGHLPRTHGTPAENQDLEYRELHSHRVLQAANTMRFLRAAVGFMFFHLAFWLRTEIAGTAWFAFAVGLGNLSILAANWAAPSLRSRMRTESMLLLSLVMIATAGIGAGVSGVFIAGILLTAVVNSAAAIGRVAFESTVQAGAPDADKVGAFARFETHNQLAWVAGGLVPVVLSFDGHVGSWTIGVLGAVGAVVLLRDRRASRSPAVRARARGHRAR